MTKVLFLLSAVVMVVAGFFSYQNRDTFINTRKGRIDTVAKLKEEMRKVAELNTEITGVRDKISGVDTEVQTAKEKLNLAKVNLKRAESDAEQYSKDVEQKNNEINKYKKQITNLPAGVTLETMNEDVNKLKQTIADSEAQATKIQEQVATKDADVKKTQSRLEGIIEKIESRKKLFDRNSLNATIVAVNNDWGFVVIDGGENKGITADAKLLVTRGQETIGRLSIIGVDSNKTVANIDQKSVRPGMNVAPGDRVILETLFQ
jgi:peptidoglycan hydrolase CwlO-like protein